MQLDIASLLEIARHIKRAQIKDDPEEWRWARQKLDDLCEGSEGPLHFANVLHAAHYAAAVGTSLANTALVYHAQSVVDALLKSPHEPWWNHYEHAALLTASPMCLGAEFSENAGRLTNGALGIAGELMELDELLRHSDSSAVAVIKEIGDVLWYVAVLCSVLSAAGDQHLQLAVGIESAATASARTDFPQAGLQQVVELSKKVVFQSHVLYGGADAGIKAGLIDIVMWLSGVARLVKATLLNAAQMNLVKLYARYPGGFSEHGSINRIENVVKDQAAQRGGDSAVDGTG